MKRIIIFFLMLGASSFSYAAEINSGQFNVETHKVELNVTYGGGCFQHSFELKLSDDGCRESFPVDCDLNLVHSTTKSDSCKALITQDLELDLPDEVLTENYYERAFLTVLGDLDTFVFFQLPY